MMPVADQQEGDDARQLPEDRQQDQVSGENDAEHRPHEGEEQRKEAGDRIFGCHVIAGVEHDEHADRSHQNGEQPGKAVHSQGEVEAELGYPGKFIAQDAA